MSHEEMTWYNAGMLSVLGVLVTGLLLYLRGIGTRVNVLMQEYVPRPEFAEISEKLDRLIETDHVKLSGFSSLQHEVATNGNRISRAEVFIELLRNQSPRVLKPS